MAAAKTPTEKGLEQLSEYCRLGFLGSGSLMIFMSDSYFGTGISPAMDEHVVAEKLSFVKARKLLDMVESVPVRLGSPSDDVFVTRMLISLSDSYYGSGKPPVGVELRGPHKLTFNRLREVLGVFESKPLEATNPVLKALHAAQLSKRGRRKRGEKVNRLRSSNEIDVPEKEYQMLAVDVGPRPKTYDNEMWMIYSTTSNHMTPNEKYFATLDPSHKVPIKFVFGDGVMSEGIGDVVIMTDRGKKTVKNVLFVPEINRNVLSVGQLTRCGYEIVMTEDKCTIKDGNGRLFGETMWEDRGFFLRFQVVVERNSCSNELPEYQMLAFDVGIKTYENDMWMIYSNTSNHMTPCEKYFTTLDRSHKALINFVFGDGVMAEGIGDVVIMTDEGKMTIKNVLFVPEIDRNVLSVGQLTQSGYGIVMTADKCTVTDQTGSLFGETKWEDIGFYLRLKVVEGNLAS